MASREGKLLGRLRDTKSGWSSKNLSRLLEYHDFEWRDGKHRVFRHTIHTDLIITIPRSHELLPVYPREVEKLIDIIENRETEDDGQ